MRIALQPMIIAAIAQIEKQGRPNIVVEIVATVLDRSLGKVARIKFLGELGRTKNQKVREAKIVFQASRVYLPPEMIKSLLALSDTLGNEERLQAAIDILKEYDLYPVSSEPR